MLDFVNRTAKRLVVGRPLRTTQMGETLLPKSIALPVFCSDPLSSNAYATEEILLALSIGGLTLFHLSWQVAAAIIVLLLVVVASYRETCHAYPTGGGAYAVSKANLGRNAALVAASALLVDYVLTVAVSVAAGIANLASAFPALAPHAVGLSVGVIALLALTNLRGVRESGTIFAIPTYGFILLVFGMLAWGGLQLLEHRPLAAESASFGIAPSSETTDFAVVVVLMRAFAQGCTALTGVEAVSNGVPNFRKPKAKNAANTLAIMGGLTVTMFAGITALALATGVHVAEYPEHLIGVPDDYQQRTVIAQVGAAVFGDGSILFFGILIFTALILLLAANTAFNGFPILASILSADGYLPRQFSRRGDRLVFSNGVVILAVCACLLIWAFDASTTKLIQLYIIGVFVSFTLSQSGMVRHWTSKLRRVRAGEEADATTFEIRRSRLINLIGAMFTGLVLVVVLITKFVHGAWIVVIAMPIVFLLMRGIHAHYARVALELRPNDDAGTLPPRTHAIVLVSRLHSPTLRAVTYARATRPSTLTVLTVQTNSDETARLEREWNNREIPAGLTILSSPYRDVTRPVLDYIRELHRQSPRDIIVVFIPEYVVRHWWEHLLHNQSALRLKTRLLFVPGVMVTSVPWQLTR